MLSEQLAHWHVLTTAVITIVAVIQVNNFNKSTTKITPNTNLCVFKLLFDIFYNSSAVKAGENATNELWMDWMCANHLSSDLGQCTNTVCC